MSAIVKSIQKFSVALPASTALATEELAAGTVTANCVPYICTRITTGASNSFQEYATDAYFTNPGGTPTLNIETGSAATRALVVEVTVIEFDTSVSNTSVQQGTFDFTTTETNTTESLTAVDLAKTYPYVTWQMGGATSAYGACFCFVEFASNGTDDDLLDFDRSVNGAVAMSGHWYTVESDEFTVQAIQNYFSGASNTESLSPSVTLAQTACFGSSKNDNTADNNERSTIDCVITANDITCQCPTAAGYRQGTWYAVSFDSSVGNVQHGTRAQVTSIASDSFDITSVDRTRSLVHPTSNPGCFTNGSFPGTSADDTNDAFCAWDFVDDDTIRVQHSTAGGEASNDLTWQVIEWELTAAGPAPSRRVMVIS